MQISAIVVVFNEEGRLRDCLESLKRFDDVKVVDIGSRDRSVDIAREMGFDVVQHPWVPIGEMVLPAMMPTMQHDWIIRVDPDEVLPSRLIDDLLQLDADERWGIVSVPYQYHFLGKPLDTTAWGGIRPIPRVINRKRTTVTAEVHRTLLCKPGYEIYDLPSRSGNAVLHYWVHSYSQLFSKHDHYIEMEGKSRYNNGQRFSWRLLMLSPLRSLQYSLVRCSGWRGGWNGWFLSLFFAVYDARGLWSLRQYEKTVSGTATAQ